MRQSFDARHVDAVSRFVGQPLLPKRIGHKRRLGRPHLKKIVFLRLLGGSFIRVKPNTKLCAFGARAEGCDPVLFDALDLKQSVFAARDQLEPRGAKRGSRP